MSEFESKKHESTASNSNIVENCNPSAGSAAARKESYRGATADRVPFILRAWWLREFEEYRDLVFRDERCITGPIWSVYSDPGCDLGGLDYSYELDDE